MLTLKLSYESRKGRPSSRGMASSACFHHSLKILVASTEPSFSAQSVPYSAITSVSYHAVALRADVVRRRRRRAALRP